MVLSNLRIKETCPRGKKSVGDMYLTVIVALALIGVVLTDPIDTCTPAALEHGEENCCSFPSSAKAQETQSLMMECSKISPIPQNPQDPGLLQGALDCFGECIYTKLGFLDGNKKINLEAVKSYGQEIFTGEMAQIALKSEELCFEKAQSSINESSQCKSGARQMLDCFNRELYLNCPAKQWTNSETCNAFKAKLYKCPNLVVTIG